jgi:hypothetical protein
MSFALRQKYPGGPLTKLDKRLIKVNACLLMDFDPIFIAW